VFVLQRNREEVKLLKFILPVLALLFLWNYLTCQFCGGSMPNSGSIGPFSYSGTNGTVGECAIDHSNSPVTWSYTGATYQVNIYIPGLGCFSNSPTPLYINAGPIKIAITTWAKGFHRVPMMYLRYQ
jgi:hypothetical protein